jgi:hypothetical protein
MLAVAAGFLFDLRARSLLPGVAAVFVSRRPILAQRSSYRAFMRAMAEAAKIQHTDKEFVYKVLGKFRLRQKDPGLIL